MGLFNRLISVDIPGVPKVADPLEGFRITFDINKNNKVNTNACKLRIYNLSDNSRNIIKELDEFISVSAGYEAEGPKLLFVGDVVKIDHRLVPPDKVTELEIADGMAVLRSIRDEFSFSPQPVRTILNKIIESIGLPVRPIPGIDSDIFDQEFANGFAYSGRVLNALTKVLERINYEWSIQNNEIQIVPEGGLTPKAPIVVNYANGLLERPERLSDIRALFDPENAQVAFKIKMLLNPLIEPSDQIDLQDGEAPGLYRVDEMQHSGDNRGGDFITTCEISEVVNG